MKDFDTSRRLRAEIDRSFTIGGETFVRRATVRPEATEPWERVAFDTSHTDTIAALDETILNLIESGKNGADHKRWLKLREREDDAVSLGDILEIVEWLVTEQTNRPTPPSVNSSGEPEATGTSSTDGSSSPVTLVESTV